MLIFRLTLRYHRSLYFRSLALCHPTAPLFRFQTEWLAHFDCPNQQAPHSCAEAVISVVAEGHCDALGQVVEGVILQCSKA